GRHLAASVRTSIYNYTIAIDGRAWDKEFSCVWEPKFNPKDNSVTAPVKLPEGWTIARHGKPIWQGRYIQLWHHMYSPDGNRIAAIGAPEYGKWTIVEDDRPWRIRFKDLVTDAVYSPAGDRIACVGKSDGKWHIAVADGGIFRMRQQI
ncbi:MAG: WD40 repeat domain-containing protein, partial [Desulfosalsimonas sp.]